MDGWDWIVIIGHRYSKSTFNANKYPRPTKDYLVHLKLKPEMDGIVVYEHLLC